MNAQGSQKPVVKGKRPKSEVLTRKQFFLILGIVAVVALVLADLYWRGFPIGKTIAPIIIGSAFVIGMGFSIKTGAITWRGGGRTLRSEKPIAFWFWVSVFTFAGLLPIIAGLAELARLATKH